MRIINGIYAMIALLLLAMNGVNGQKFLPVTTWDGPTPAGQQSKPGYLEKVSDPVYSTHFKRVADFDIWDKDIGLINDNETRHYYSLRPVFNSNSKLYTVNWQQIRLVETNQFIGRANELVAGGKFDNATWSKVNPEILYGTMSNMFVALNVVTKDVDTIYIFESFITGSRDRLYMDNKQSIAGDDDYMVVSDVPTGGQQVAVLDIQNREIIGLIEDAYADTIFTIRVTDNGTSIRMNVGISPSGEFIVLGGANGEHLYDKYFNYIRTLPNHGHADFGIDTEGNDVYVSICPAKYEVLSTGEVFDLLGKTYACGHVNASANYKQPGWVYLSINRDDNDRGANGNKQGYEIIAVKLDPDGTQVRKIIHPHNTGSGLKESAYAVPNPEGSLLMFNSSWDDFNTNAEFDAYMVELTTEDSASLSMEVMGKGEVVGLNAKIFGIEGEYYFGYTIGLSAVDTALGHKFSHWSGDISSTDNPVFVKLDADKHVIANFEEVPVYSLSTTTIGEGRVSSSANGDYTENTEVKITAFPTFGYDFLYWEGDLTGNENPTTVYMDSSINLTAVFSGATGITNKNSNSARYNLKCYPNPFSGLTTIQYEINKTAKVKLSVIDVAGNEVAVLFKGYQEPGIHEVKWNGKDGSQSLLPGGIYLNKLDIENEISVYCKMILN